MALPPESTAIDGWTVVGSNISYVGGRWKPARRTPQRRPAVRRRDQPDVRDRAGSKIRSAVQHGRGPEHTPGCEDPGGFVRHRGPDLYVRHDRSQSRQYGLGGKILDLYCVRHDHDASHFSVPRPSARPRPWTMCVSRRSRSGCRPIPMDGRAPDCDESSRSVECVPATARVDRVARADAGEDRGNPLRRSLHEQVSPVRSPRTQPASIRHSGSSRDCQRRGPLCV